MTRQKLVNGKWVPVVCGKYIFKVGVKVEICLQEEKFRDVWFPATIVEDLGEGRFLVEYNCSGIKDESGLRRVNIDHLHIRPPAPVNHIWNTGFGLLQKVDAFYDFGWWKGVITKKLADRRSVVYFKYTNKEKKFRNPDLRHHWEWKDNEWTFLNAYQDPVTREELGEAAFLNPTNPIEDTTTGIDKQTYNVTTPMKRSKPSNLDNNGELITPNKRFKSGVDSHDPSLSNGDASKEVSNPPVGQAVDKTKKLFRGKSTPEPSKQDKSVEVKRPLITFTSKKGKLSAGSEGPKALPMAASDSTTPNIVQEKHVTEKLPIPIVLGLQCNALVTRSMKSKQLDSEGPQTAGEPKTPQSTPQSGDPLAPKTTGNQDKETDGDASTIRRSARISKPTQKTSSALSHQNGDASVKKLSNRSPVELTLQQERSDEPVKGKRGRKPAISLTSNPESSPQDHQGSSKQQENGNTGTDVEKSLVTVSDDQPLSTLFPATLESAGKKLPESVKSTKCNDQKLSFAKRSSFWETIESTEAFCVIPQNPHFRPLDDLKENVRERHAIYKMVDFSSVFEKTSLIQFDHPRTEIEDQLETLLELETHGFDVGPIRNRLMEMLSFKDKEEGHSTRSKESKDNIGSQRLEVQERNKAIELIDKQVEELLDKRQKLAKENEESELNIVSWEEQVNESEEARRECRRKFDELATAPF